MPITLVGRAVRAASGSSIAGTDRPRRGAVRIVALSAATVMTLAAGGLAWLFATAPGGCSGARLRAGSGRNGVRRIDEVLPAYDVTLVCSILVEAPPDVTFAAILEANILDPVIAGLFRVRELPRRTLARIRRERRPVFPARLTFADLLRMQPAPSILAETPGVEIVLGSVGRFWETDYGAHHVPAQDFAAFAEPGYAKLAISFHVAPAEGGASLLRYEARTAATDDAARRRFQRYWRVIRPGVALVMRRALGLIRVEAERRSRIDAEPGAWAELR